MTELRANMIVMRTRLGERCTNCRKRCACVWVGSSSRIPLNWTDEWDSCRIVAEWHSHSTVTRATLLLVEYKTDFHAPWLFFSQLWLNKVKASTLRVALFCCNFNSTLPLRFYVSFLASYDLSQLLNVLSTPCQVSIKAATYMCCE